MQLFSRNKALAALSLGALAALGACGDDVTVPVAPAAPVVISITPPAASMNVGESLNFAVQITGGTNATNTTAPTLASCTSSNAAVATAAVSGSSCRVTAVAAGNATITAAASTGNTAAAAVSVSAQTPAISSLAVSPAVAQLAIGQSVTLVPTVQPAGRTVTYSYATSSASIATVSAAGVVQAVAPGVATITVTANGSATGFAAATISQAVTINVSSNPAAITALTVQPSSLTMALGGTQQLTASVQQPTGAPAATVAYASTASSIASVTAAGVVTAVAPGTAVITATASLPAASVSAAWPQIAVVQLIPVTVTPGAQVVINQLTQGGSTIDISNVTNQMEADLSIQPNGQNVSAVNLWICDPAETVAQCAARTNNVPAAQQSFTASGAQTSTVRMFVNTAEFARPDFTTGADANTLYKNGPRTIVATLTTANTGSTIASNTISQVNFNNPDGFTIQWNLPANSATDANGVTWYGGPDTPDALTPNARSGTGSFVVVPVVYTPGRSVQQVSLTITARDPANPANIVNVCGNTILDTQRPFGASYGTRARVTTDQTALNFFCGDNLPSGVLGMQTLTSGYAPNIASAIDNQQNAYPVPQLSPAASTSIFNDYTNNASATNGYRQSIAYRQNYNYIPGDYRGVSINAFDIRGGAGNVDSAWVNAAYFLAGVNPTTQTGTGSLRYRASDAGVGLLSSNGSEIGAGAASRNTLFTVCLNPAPTLPLSAPVNCGAAVATGGITATVGSINLPEAANLTNSAYTAQVAETDRLGNRGTSVLYSWSNSSAGTSQNQTPSRAAFDGNTNSSPTPAAFGVDLVGPSLVAIPNTNDPAPITGYARTDLDSMYVTNASGLQTAAATTAGVPLADAAQFAVRFTDSRSGFPSCRNNSTNCFTNNTTLVRGGSFQIVRRIAPPLATVANDAQVENLVAGNGTTADLTFRQSIDATVYAGDNSVRQFAIPVAMTGQTTRNNASTTPANIGQFTQAGYYTFSGTLVDRAGNTTTIPARSVALDNASPLVTGIQIPAVLTGGTTVGFTPAGTDDLEAIAGDLALSYRQLGRLNGGDVGATVQPQRVRFRRVPNYTSTGLLGLWHNPFQAISDNKLTTPVGPGSTLAGTALSLPIPFVQQLTTVNSTTNAPLTAAQITAAGNEVKPDTVHAVLYDIRSTSSTSWSDRGASASLPQVIFPGQVPTATKDWTTSAGAGITSWAAFNPASGNLEFRAQTSTSITNPPFQSVFVIRQANATEWEYLGTATFAGTLDQGGSRFFRYTFAFSGVSQGQFTMAGLQNGDIVRGIGADASGNALSTANVTFGLANALPTNFTVNVAPNVLVDMKNAPDASATQAVTLSNTNNTNGANIVYSCSSNSSFVTATMTNPTTCTLTSNGVASGTVQATITFTATGSLTNFNSNSISITRNVNRVP